MDATYEGFTQEQLSVAFDVVANPDDQKAEIVAVVLGEMVLLMVAAIKFYTATTPQITLDVETMHYIITSEGYRRGPAGDY